MANPSRPNLESLTARTMAASSRALVPLSVIAAALFFLAGSAHAQVFVSNYQSGYVEKCTEDGASCVSMFNTNSSTEGIACVKLTNNKIYVADNSNVIQVFPLSGGSPTTITLPSSASIAALAFNITGSRLYAAAYVSSGTGHIYAVDVNGGPCLPSGNCNVATSASHDVAVGPDGDVYGTEWDNNTGVVAFKTMNAVPGLALDTAKYPPNGVFISNTQLNAAGGMVFDGSGNLWATSAGGGTDGVSEFAGPSSLNPVPGTLLNSVTAANTFPLGLDVSPINPAGPPVDVCKGCIVVAEFNGHKVQQINPTSCTGGPPGTCTLQNYISTATLGGTTPKPKYVHFLEDCCDTGYVEVCKLSCVYNQVTGNFSFTATNSGDVVGPFQVPVNACSGPMQIPNGVVNIKEAARSGVVLQSVVAYDYDYFGNQINALYSENLPFTNANVNVVSGDVSTETVVGFTNCMSGPGELKICKVAGSNDLIGDPFTFTAKGTGAPMTVIVPAGPAPGGYCEVVGSFPAGTPVLVAEPTGQHNATVSNIAVVPPNRQGTKTANTVIAMIDTGTTEVTFTNVDNVMPAGCPTTGQIIYNDGPVNATLAAWPINFGFVTSDTFSVASGGTISSFCFNAWDAPGDVPQTVEASITSQEFGGTTFLDQVVNLSCTLVCAAGTSYNGGTCGVSPTHQPTGQSNVWACTGPLGPVQLAGGSYWLDLQNGVTAQGNPLYWDQNDGPSSASENQIGTIPAEAFVIY